MLPSVKLKTTLRQSPDVPAPTVSAPLVCDLLFWIAASCGFGISVSYKILESLDRVNVYDRFHTTGSHALPTFRSNPRLAAAFIHRLAERHETPPYSATAVVRTGFPAPIAATASIAISCNSRLTASKSDS